MFPAFCQLPYFTGLPRSALVVLGLKGPPASDFNNIIASCGLPRSWDDLENSIVTVLYDILHFITALWKANFAIVMLTIVLHVPQEDNNILFT